MATDELTVFNMGIATLERIHTILVSMNQSSVSGNPLETKRYLKILYKETYPFLNDDEKKAIKESWKKINENIYVKDNIIQYSRGIQTSMDNVELWLRDKLKQKGLLMAQGEDPKFALK